MVPRLSTAVSIRAGSSINARAFADFDVLCLQEVAANFSTLKGSQGEDQFALLAALLPGFTPSSGRRSTSLAPMARAAPSAT